MKLSEQLQYDCSPAAIEEIELMESKLANLQPQAEALHNVAAALGMAAGSDVTLAVTGVRSLVAKYEKLEQAHQALLANRDEWQSYARQAGAQSVQRYEVIKLYEKAFDELFSHCGSNGIFNAWQKPFNCTSLNLAHEAAQGTFIVAPAPDDGVAA